MAISKITLNGVTQMDVTGKTVTPETMLNGITSLKNDGTDITGNIASKSSSDLTVSGATVTVPAGYYGSAASKSVASGSATTPATTITANPSISVSSGGLITATASATKSVIPTVSAGYVSSGTAGTITVSGSNTSQLSTQAATTITPTKQSQTAVASGKYTTGAVTVAAIPSAYQDVTGVTATAADVRVGKYFVNSSGTLMEGTMTDIVSALVWYPNSTDGWQIEGSFSDALAAVSANKPILVHSVGNTSIGPKNWLSGHLTLSTATVNGITYTWNGNTCTVTGTCTATSYHWVDSGAWGLPDGLSAGDSVVEKFQNAANGLQMIISFYNSSGGYISGSDQITSIEKTFSIPANAPKMRVGLVVAKNVSFATPVTITLDMIRLLTPYDEAVFDDLAPVKVQYSENSPNQITLWLTSSTGLIWTANGVTYFS